MSRERETRAIKRKDRGDKMEKIIIRNSCDLLIKRKKGEKKWMAGMQVVNTVTYTLMISFNYCTKYLI